MSFEIKGTITKRSTNGALVMEETGLPVTPQFEEQVNGDNVTVALYINDRLFEERQLQGTLIAMYSENHGTDDVDETIIVMENDGSVDDIVAILNENLGAKIAILVKD